MDRVGMSEHSSWNRLARCLLALLAALFLFIVATGGSAARQAPGTEAVQLELEAVYLFKFANYVEWPPDAFSHAADPIVIGILGSDPLANALKQLTRRKKVKGRNFQIRRVRSADDLGAVHILFIGAANPTVAADALASLRDKHVLTVSDSPGVFAIGSMVNFVMTDQRLRFEVAMRPVARSGLRLSALMLTAAQQVKKDEP